MLSGNHLTCTTDKNNFKMFLRIILFCRLLDSQHQQRYKLSVTLKFATEDAGSFSLAGIYVVSIL